MIVSKTADDAYFYFTDHLGSTTHITDRSGDVAQYAAYTPYGSLFREYRSVQPYKFNGKELDQETGYYYYGARYYDPITALWLGTDPLKHKYPDIGAYVYCHGNPMMRIDPTGMEDIKIKDMTDYRWHNFDVENDRIILGEVEANLRNNGHHYDQPYGQTITGGIGKGSESTSRYKGRPIDSSGLPTSGFSAKSFMEYVYEFCKKIADIAPMVLDVFSDDNNISINNGNKQIISEVDPSYSESVNCYPVTQGAFTYHGVRKTKNFMSESGEMVNEGDTVGYRIVTKSPKGTIKKDTLIYTSKEKARDFLNNQRK